MEKMKALTRAVIPVLVYEIVAVIVISIVSGYAPGNDVLTDMSFQYIISMTIAVLFVIPLLERDRRVRRIVMQGEERPKISPTSWIILIILSSALSICLNYLISFSGLVELSSAYKTSRDSLYSGRIITESIHLIIIAPLAEELVFRGLFYNRLKEGFSKKVAMIFAALLFAFVHFNIVQGIYAFVFGVVIIYIYEFFGTILAPILFHMVANAVSLLITENEIINEWLMPLSRTIIMTVITSIIAIIGILYFISKKKSIFRNDI